MSPVFIPAVSQNQKTGETMFVARGCLKGQPERKGSAGLTEALEQEKAKKLSEIR